MLNDDIAIAKSRYRISTCFNAFQISATGTDVSTA